MRRVLCLICMLAVTRCTVGESTQSFKDAVLPLAQECMAQVGATEDDFQTVLHRNRLETRTAKCLLACVYQKMGAFANGGDLLDGDHIMPIMDRLYGFREFKTVMRAQVVHSCVNEDPFHFISHSCKSARPSHIDLAVLFTVNGRDTDPCELVTHALHCVIEHY